MKSKGLLLAMGLLAVSQGAEARMQLHDEIGEPDFSEVNGSRYMGAACDWISVRMEGFETWEMPSAVNSGKKSILIRREVDRIRDGHGKVITDVNLQGELVVKLYRWDGSDGRVIGRVAVTNRWNYHQDQRVTLDLSTLEPDGYVITAELPPFIGVYGYGVDTNHTGSGQFGIQQVTGRNVMRFGVFKDLSACGGLFGVGNMMAHHGWANRGFSIKGLLEIKRDFNPVSVWLGDPFHNAILGAYSHEGGWIDQKPPAERAKNEEGLVNPIGGMLDVWSPAGKKELDRRAESTGKRLARQPMVISANLNGEANHLNRGSVCTSKYADADFRAFCRKRYGGDLEKANKAWNRSYASWEDVRQPIHIDVEISNDAAKAKGEASTDWFSNSGRVTGQLVRHLNDPKNVEMAMDWYRWRSKSTYEAQVRFVEIAHKYDRKTKYITNYCWPTLFQHLVTPSLRKMDGGGLDAQYICHFPRTPGSDDQMLDGYEMVESVLKGKPVYAYETYVQPDWPKEAAALQNWALVAHGVSVNHLECWKAYADRGPSVFKNGPKAWTRPEGQCMMLFCVDTDGTRLPPFYGIQRSAREIAAFHEKYNGNSLQRIRGRVAYYLSDETSMYIMLSTGDRPYDSRKLCTPRHVISSRLRLAGVRLEYLDDTTVVTELTKRDYDTVVMPPTPRMIPEAAAALARFEKEGGKIIRLEDGLEEDFFTKHPEVARRAWWKSEKDTLGETFPTDIGKDKAVWYKDVEVVVRNQKGTNRKFVFVLNRRDLAARGTLTGPDFPKGTTFVNALTGEKTGVTFDLPGYGYRVLIQD